MYEEDLPLREAGRAKGSMFCRSVQSSTVLISEFLHLQVLAVSPDQAKLSKAAVDQPASVLTSRINVRLRARHRSNM